MKKYLSLLILLVIPFNVFAASGSIKATYKSSSVTLNSTFNVTVTVSSDGTLGSWQYGLSYDKSKLSLQSGDPSIVGYGDGTFKSKSYTYKFKAIATGKATITIDNPKIADWDTDSYISTSKTDLSITITEPVVVNYSSDNNLKSLSVDGFELSPAFSKDTLEYNITTLPTTEKIKINATSNDKKAKVSGTGEINIIEGTNTLNVVVTAENGATKTYIINVLVPEKDPIKYTFNNGEYNLLRKIPEDKKPVNFNNSTIKINEEDIPCLQNENLNLTLIYLRNGENKEHLYIYNHESNEVYEYNELSNNLINIYILNKEIKLKKLTKTTLNINDNIVNAYQIKKGSKDYLIYGVNTSTGKENIYLYDKENETISLFNEDDYDYLVKKINLFTYLTLGLGLIVVILLSIMFITFKGNKKMKLLINKLKKEEKDKE